MNAAVDAVIDYAEYVRTHVREFFEPSSWQLRFYELGATKPHRLVSAANQTGKTTGGCYEASCHILGDYPDWWEPHWIRYEHAPLTWVAGVDTKQIPEVVQKKLFGERVVDGVTFDGTGLIPAEKIIKVKWSRQNPDLAETIRVRNTFGTCVVRIKAYTSIGAEKKKSLALAGASKVDLLIVDEQPPPMAQGQMIQRTMHGRHIAGGEEVDGGAVMILYTPERGADELYDQFRDDPEPHQGFMNVTWDDLEPRIMSDEQKQRTYFSLPAHEREMRSKGIPMLGGALVFPVVESEIKVTDFLVPGHWKQILGIDFGISHPFAAAKVAWDAEEDIMYLIAGWKKPDVLPAVHLSKLKSFGSPALKVVYPHDGDSREKGSGELLIDIYKKEGLENFVQFRNDDGSIYREPGILDMLNRMESGRFKVFASVIDFFYEMRLYHRKDGTIVDANDDLISATRYACGMVKRFGVQPGRRNSSEKQLAAYYARMRKVS